jgi:hypothetical protein
MTDPAHPDTAGLRAAARAYLDAEAEPAYPWVMESQAARNEGRPNREVERMERIARARVLLEEALAATEAAPIDVERLNRIEAAFTEAVNAPSTSRRGIVVPHWRDVERIWKAIAKAYREAG